MEHEPEPGWAGATGQDAAGQDAAGQDAAGQDAAGRDNVPGTGWEQASAESAGITAGAVADSAASGSPAPGIAVPDSAGPAAPAEQPTGEPRVDAALKLLDRLPGLPVSDHPELFEQVHAQLSEVLSELESGPGTAGPASG